MKTLRLFHCLFYLTLFCLTARASYAQVVPSANLPGYWNLETNLTTRDYTIVRFYDGQDQLVYEGYLPQLCLNLAKGPRGCRQRTTLALAQALQRVLHDPANAHQALTGLAQQLGQDPRAQHLYARR